MSTTAVRAVTRKLGLLVQPTTDYRLPPLGFASHFSCFPMLPPHLVSNPTPHQRRPAATSQSQTRRRPSRQRPTHRQGNVHNTINSLLANVNCKDKIIGRVGISTNPCPMRIKRPPQRNVAQPPPAVVLGSTLVGIPPIPSPSRGTVGSVPSRPPPRGHRAPPKRREEAVQEGIAVSRPAARSVASDHPSGRGVTSVHGRENLRPPISGRSRLFTKEARGRRRTRSEAFRPGPV